jgi:hypothetical protein
LVSEVCDLGIIECILRVSCCGFSDAIRNYGMMDTDRREPRRRVNCRLGFTVG